jgi:hypothetical protein
MVTQKIVQKARYVKRKLGHGILAVSEALDRRIGQELSV